MSQILTEAIVGVGQVARIGGDEFTCIIEETVDINYFYHYQQRIVDAIQQYNASKIKPYSIDISLGCSLLNPAAPDTLENLLLISRQPIIYRKRNKKA